MKSFAIVPAAGYSRRMGKHKLLLPWENELAVVDATLQRWLQSRVHETIVVVRADDEQLAKRCRNHSVHVIRLDVPPPEMKDSVAAALRWIDETFHPTSNDVWLLAPADMPRLSPLVVDQLLAAYRSDATDILKPVYNGRHGHPVLFSWRLARAVQALPAHQGINALADSHRTQLLHCEQPAILDDMDTPAEYESLRAAEEPPSD